jgi:hypothetical protein
LFDRIPISPRFVVPETQHRKALVLKPVRARCIGLRSLRMLPAVQFYNQPALQTDEVHDEGADRHLSAELVSPELAIAQFLPDETFGVSHVLS